jgi:hypothetical protein
MSFQELGTPFRPKLNTTYHCPHTWQTARYLSSADIWALILTGTLERDYLGVSSNRV